MSVYKSNSLGQKSIDLYSQAYDSFAKPVVPYFQTPYSYVAPYLGKADQFGNSALDSVDSHFPAVTKTNIDNLRENIVATIHYPFKVAGEGKDYVFSTYNDEYKKTGGEGLFNAGKAVLTTELRIVADALHRAGDFFGPQRDELEAQYNKYKKIGEDKFNDVKGYASGAASDVQKKGEEVKQRGQKQVDETKKQVSFSRISHAAESHPNPPRVGQLALDAPLLRHSSTPLPESPAEPLPAQHFSC